MKAIRVSEYGGPSVLKLEEIPAPQPGSGQVLVRNHAVGINPVDTYLRSNTDNRGPKLPYTPGSDAAGSDRSVVPVARVHHVHDPLEVLQGRELDRDPVAGALLKIRRDQGHTALDRSRTQYFQICHACPVLAVELL